jgi:hypothetical protein
MGDSHITLVPIRQLRIHKFILVLLNGLLESRPACSDRLGMITDPPFPGKTIRNLLFGTAGFLHLHYDLVVGVHVPGYLLGGCGGATVDLEALCRVLVVDREGEVFAFGVGGGLVECY